MSDDRIHQDSEKPTQSAEASSHKDEREELGALLKLVGTLGLTVCGGIACFFFSA